MKSLQVFTFLILLFNEVLNALIKNIFVLVLMINGDVEIIDYLHRWKQLKHGISTTQLLLLLYFLSLQIG